MSNNPNSPSICRKSHGCPSYAQNVLCLYQSQGGNILSMNSVQPEGSQESEQRRMTISNDKNPHDGKNLSYRYDITRVSVYPSRCFKAEALKIHPDAVLDLTMRIPRMPLRDSLQTWRTLVLGYSGEHLDLCNFSPVNNFHYLTLRNLAMTFLNACLVELNLRILCLLKPSV